MKEGKIKFSDAKIDHHRSLMFDIVLFFEKIGFTIFVMIFFVSFSTSFAKTNHSEILKRGIFADTPPPPQRQVTSILKPISLPPVDSLLTLKGIIYSSDGESKVIVEIISRKCEVLCEEGDVIENAKILKINESEVVFLYDDKEVSLALQKPQTGSPAISVRDTSVKVVPSTSALTSDSSAIPSRASGIGASVPVPEHPRDLKINDIVEKFRSDPNLLASVSVTPHIQDGKVEGFMINRVPEGLADSGIGIQAGDVIRRVNGVLIDSLGKAYAVYNGVLKSQSKLATVEILRSGQPMMLTYRLE